MKALVSLGNLTSVEKPQGLLSTPVPGSKATEGTATSEGVHLYADPEHLDSSKPILYADCEGLNAGEEAPFAVNEETSPPKEAQPTGRHHRFGKKLPGRARPIEWTKPNDPVRGSREFAVSNLYPRFLYTFSDVLVFVQKNPK